MVIYTEDICFSCIRLWFTYTFSITLFWNVNMCMFVHSVLFSFYHAIWDSVYNHLILGHYLFQMNCVFFSLALYFLLIFISAPLKCNSVIYVLKLFPCSSVWYFFFLFSKVLIFFSQFPVPCQATLKPDNDCNTIGDTIL